jgi:hypothetical protein
VEEPKALPESPAGMSDGEEGSKETNEDTMIPKRLRFDADEDEDDHEGSLQEGIQSTPFLGAPASSTSPDVTRKMHAGTRPLPGEVLEQIFVVRIDAFLPRNFFPDCASGSPLPVAREDEKTTIMIAEKSGDSN